MTLGSDNSQAVEFQFLRIDLPTWRAAPSSYEENMSQVSHWSYAKWRHVMHTLKFCLIHMGHVLFGLHESRGPSVNELSIAYLIMLRSSQLDWAETYCIYISNKLDPEAYSVFSLAGSGYTSFLDNQTNRCSIFHAWLGQIRQSIMPLEFHNIQPMISTKRNNLKCVNLTSSSILSCFKLQINKKFIWTSMLILSTTRMTHEKKQPKSLSMKKTMVKPEINQPH